MLEWLQTVLKVLAYTLRAASILLALTVYAAISGSHAPLTSSQVTWLIVVWAIVWFVLELAYSNTKKSDSRS